MRAARSRLSAVLHSAVSPTEEQLQRFAQFLARTYQGKVPLRWSPEYTVFSTLEYRYDEEE